MMKHDIRALSVIALAASVVSASFGQITLERQYLTVPQQCALRMSEETVTKKLNLNAAQAKAYEHAVISYLKESKKLDSSNTAKDNDRIACDRKFADACLSTLNPIQKHTILKIGIPNIGIMALLDPAVSTQVGLTPAQLQKVKSICRDFAKEDEDVSAMVAHAIEEVPEPKLGADRTKYDKKCVEVAAMYNGERQRIAKDKKAAEEKVIALMTPTQKVKWLDLDGPSPKR